ICKFLEKRGLKDKEVRGFRDEMVSLASSLKNCYSFVTTQFTRQTLKKLGVLRRGDLISLQGFVKQKLKGENRDKKKRKLLDLLKGKGKPTKRKTEDETGTVSG
ncbi:unnamed protein product, partial [Porites evermanni]